MTGRRLYEVVSAEVSARAEAISRKSYADSKHHQSSFALLFPMIPVGDRVVSWVPQGMPAFDFLPKYEREAWNVAARRLSGRK